MLSVCAFVLLEEDKVALDLQKFCFPVCFKESRQVAPLRLQVSAASGASGFQWVVTKDHVEIISLCRSSGKSKVANNEDSLHRKPAWIGELKRAGMAFATTGRNPVDVLDKSSLAAINYNVVKRIDPCVEEVGPV